MKKRNFWLIMILLLVFVTSIIISDCGGFIFKDKDHHDKDRDDYHDRDRDDHHDRDRDDHHDRDKDDHHDRDRDHHDDDRDHR